MGIVCLLQMLSTFVLFFAKTTCVLGWLNFLFQLMLLASFLNYWYHMPILPTCAQQEIQEFTILDIRDTLTCI